MSRQLALLPWVNEIFGQPASQDAGTALRGAMSGSDVPTYVYIFKG
jgi:hypothetical protein